MDLDINSVTLSIFKVFRSKVTRSSLTNDGLIRIAALSLLETVEW